MDEHHGSYQSPTCWLDWYENKSHNLTFQTYIITNLLRLFWHVPIGAKENEVACMGGLTNNLHLMMGTFYKPTATRFKILCEAKAFPSDQVGMFCHKNPSPFHCIFSVCICVTGGATWSRPSNRGTCTNSATRRVHASRRGHPFGHRTGRTWDRACTLSRCSVLYWSMVSDGEHHARGQGKSALLSQFHSAVVLTDWPTRTTSSLIKGCICGWDLAHAIGNVPLQLHDWKVDFAVWCSYKYLNAGPGAIAGLFIHEKWADTTRPRYTTFTLLDRTFHRYLPC